MKKLKILMCCQFPLTASLGGPKGYLEVAETYRMVGHQVDLVGVDEIVGEDQPYLDEAWRIKHFPLYLKDYLLRHANNYDVVEYEAIYLPFDLKDRVRAVLVARSVLLELHLRSIKIPNYPGIKPFLSWLTKSWLRNYQLNQRIEQSLAGIRCATLANVSNPSDKAILVSNGIDANKIIMQPYGISQARLNLFEEVRKKFEQNTDIVNIAFVGSFDKRKGAVEFPQIIRAITKRFPNVRFKLLGVLGQFSSVEKIYEYLGEELKEKVFIQARYKPDELPHLLKDCTLGIFPSHLESFGFGVLEMMAMGLPVVGYDSPGISMLIPKELTVQRGNHRGIVELLTKLIKDREFREESKKKCESKARDFIYENQENHSLNAYLNLCSDT